MMEHSNHSLLWVLTLMRLSRRSTPSIEFPVRKLLEGVRAPSISGSFETARWMARNRSARWNSTLTYYGFRTVEVG